jgi:diguanylate cyclase (GGDEF)-like protein
MSISQIAVPSTKTEERNRQIQRDLRSLARHDWSLWALALMVILAMTATLAAVLSSLSDSDDRIFQLTMGQSIRGLLGLVLLFSSYTFYQQLQLKNTRARLAKQVELSTQILAAATPDELTGLHDERFAQLRLETEIARARRNRTPLTILMLGLKNLNYIDNHYGPATGDFALQTLAEHVNRAIRGCDLAVRAGRGDIMVVLPECSLDQAPCVTNRLTDLVIEAKGTSIPLVLTTSSTSYRADDTSEDFFYRAHQDLENQKQTPAAQKSPVA